MKYLQGVRAKFALFFVFVTALFLFLLLFYSESTSQNTISDDMASLHKKFEVIRSESLFTGKTVSMAKNRNFLADIFQAETSPSETSEILVETKTGETLLLTSRQKGVASKMVAEYQSLPSVSVAEENQEGAFFTEDSFELSPSFSQKNDLPLKEREAPTVIVAVLDSGIDAFHPALSGEIWENKVEKNGRIGKDDDGNGLIDDISGWNFLSKNSDVSDDIGHGTHISGIIVAHETPMSSMRGVSSVGTKIMPLKIADKKHGLRLSGVLRALAYAQEQKVDVINMSFGFAEPSSLLHKSITNFVQTGGVIVSAAGNSGDEHKFYPAAYSEVYAVSSANLQGGRRESSTYGTWVDASAPAKLLSTLPDGKYGAKTGTSQAAAFMTGMYAREKFQHPERSSDDLLSTLSGLSERFSTVSIPAQKDLSISSQKWVSPALHALRMQEQLSAEKQESLDMNRLVTKTEAVVLLGELFPEWNEVRSLIAVHFMDDPHFSSISPSPYDIAEEIVTYDNLSRELLPFSEAKNILDDIFAIARSKASPPSVPKNFGQYVFLTRSEFYSLLNIYFVQ
ncbi:S8 family serine peptidase [Candidatus Peregrinibacteria bacterium]|nr:MAG: S8 family serine peptidase [Candidatus Peregrinibacteria bacterium]